MVIVWGSFVVLDQCCIRVVQGCVCIEHVLHLYTYLLIVVGCCCGRCCWGKCIWKIGCWSPSHFCSQHILLFIWVWPGRRTSYLMDYLFFFLFYETPTWVKTMRFHDKFSNIVTCSIYRTKQAISNIENRSNESMVKSILDQVKENTAINFSFHWVVAKLKCLSSDCNCIGLILIVSVTSKEIEMHLLFDRIRNYKTDTI